MATDTHHSLLFFQFITAGYPSLVLSKHDNINSHCLNLASFCRITAVQRARAHLRNLSVLAASIGGELHRGRGDPVEMDLRRRITGEEHASASWFRSVPRRGLWTPGLLGSQLSRVRVELELSASRGASIAGDWSLNRIHRIKKNFLYHFRIFSSYSTLILIEPHPLLRAHYTWASMSTRPSGCFFFLLSYLSILRHLACRPSALVHFSQVVCFSPRPVLA